MRIRAALGVVLALGVPSGAAGGGPAEPDERAGIRADYNRELAALRQRHQLAMAEVPVETASLEQKMRVLRQMVPPQFEAERIEKRLQAVAEASEMMPLEIKRVDGSERIRLADGGETPYARFRVDVSGHDRYVSLGYFLDRIGRLTTVVELETLSLEAAPRGTERFTARLAFPVSTGWPPMPPPVAPAPPPAPGSHASLEDERFALQRSLFEHRDFYRRMADAAREPIRRMQAEVFAIAAMKATGLPARYHRALARFEAGAEGRRIVFNRARFGDRTVIEGVAVGAPARAALRPAFEKAGFVVETLDIAPAGECRAFSLVARLAPTEDSDSFDGSAGVEVGPSRFDPRTAATCSALPQPPSGSVVARGTSGDLTVRLRDTDLADVFQLLATLTDASFVVNADVKGRVNVDLERATLDEVLAALGQAGIFVGPGPLRLVSRAGSKAPGLPRDSREQRVSLFFKDGSLPDVVRLFQEISGRAAWSAPVMNARVTLFATEVPWDVALHGIAASVGMSAVIEGDRLFVGPAAMAKAPWQAGAVEVFRATAGDDDSGWGKVTELKKISPEDLTPVGMARTADGMKGVAYGPGRLLWVLETDAELFEARVFAVDGTGVTFATKDGRKTAVRFAP